MITKDDVFRAIHPIQDPEIKISVVDLGLIYDVDISSDGQQVKVRMTLTSPACPVGPEIVALVKTAVEAIEEVEQAHVELVWEPLWNPKTMASDDAKDLLGIW
jgi:metal-sulfur cluster biosynthetic enzyme